MKIIIITGDKNTGKSTTLSKNFRDWLIDHDAKEIKVIKQGRIEYEGVFQYKGKTIAIHSPGDLNWVVVYAIVTYIYCDILVLTGKTEVRSIVKLIEVIKANKLNCVIKKKEATDADNNRALKEIIAEL